MRRTSSRFAQDRWSEGVEATWAIREGETLAGMIGLHGIKLGGAGEIGYWMARALAAPRAAHRGRPGGHRLGLQHCRAALQRIEWRAVVGNVASARTARTLGFRYEGVLRRALSNSSGATTAGSPDCSPTDDRMPQPWPVLED